MKTFSFSFSAIRKGFLEPGGSLRRLFIRRVLLNKNTLVFQISGKESTFFGWWVLLHYAGIHYPASARSTSSRTWAPWSAWSTSSTTWAPWGAAALGGRVGRRRGLDLPQAAGCCSSAGPRPGRENIVRRWCRGGGGREGGEGGGGGYTWLERLYCGRPGEGLE